jgi:hypothetical protein
MLVDDNWAVLQKIFDEAGIPLLAFPVYHAALNPIVMYKGLYEEQGGRHLPQRSQIRRGKQLEVPYVNEVPRRQDRTVQAVW